MVEVIKWLSIADRYTKMYLDRCLAPLGLNASQYMYVLKICENPGITQDSFFGFFYVNPSNITRALAVLEKEGYVRKDINLLDKRTCRLYPTARAGEAYGKIRAIIGNWEAQMLEDMTQQELELLSNHLHRLAEKSMKL